VFAIPALNRDVITFDTMAEALHYHMFQMVIVANNGTFGGSNAYCPWKDPWKRQVFHLHGQPQASIAFLEIDDIRGYLRRKREATIDATPPHPWKAPPAGLGQTTPGPVPTGRDARAAVPALEPARSDDHAHPDTRPHSAKRAPR
jgi:hypothetical protein